MLHRLFHPWEISKTLICHVIGICQRRMRYLVFAKHMGHIFSYTEQLLMSSEQRHVTNAIWEICSQFIGTGSEITTKETNRVNFLRLCIKWNMYFPGYVLNHMSIPFLVATYLFHDSLNLLMAHKELYILWLVIKSKRS